MCARDVFTFAYCLGLLLAIVGFAGRRLTEVMPGVFDQLLQGGLWIFILAMVFSFIFSLGDGKEPPQWDREL